MKFRWLTSWDDIWSDTFVSEWLDWMEKSENAHVFFHPTMVKAWVDTFLQIRDIQPLFCVYTHKDTVVFLPLILWKKDWKSVFANVIVPVGYSDFDYHTPILVGNSSEFEWSEFWDNIFLEINQNWGEKYDLLEIDGIPKDCISNDNGWEFTDKSSLIKLSKFSSYDEFMHSIKAKERSGIKRRIRRLKELGSFEYKVFKPDQVNEALDVLTDMLHHHSLRWPNAYKAPNYHNNLIKEMLPKGFLHFSQISIKGEPICWDLCFEYKNTCYGYVTSFVEEYKNYSPGKLLMFMIFEQIFNTNHKNFDLLRGNEDYKNKLPTVTTSIYNYKSTNSKISSRVKKELLHFKKIIQK